MEEQGKMFWLYCCSLLVCNLGQVTLSFLGLSSPFCHKRELDMKIFEVSSSSQIKKKN